MKRISILFLVCLFVSGCSLLKSTEKEADKAAPEEEAGQQEETDKEEEEEEESAEPQGELVEGEKIEKNQDKPLMERDLPEIPDTYEDAVDYTITGEFAGKTYEEQQ